jgi:signal transduction histidine kinase
MDSNSARAAQVGHVLRQALAPFDLKSVLAGARTTWAEGSTYAPAGAPPDALAAFAREVEARLGRFARQGTQSFDWNFWWAHSTSVAACGYLAALRAGATSIAWDAFGAGLLHDAGRLALIIALPKAYARITRATDDDDTQVIASEHDIFGMDHAAAGRLLLDAWGAPAPWADAVWLHHQPAGAIAGAARHPQLAWAVAFANRLMCGDTPDTCGEVFDELRARARLSHVNGAELRDAASRMSASLSNAPPRATGTGGPQPREQIGSVQFETSATLQVLRTFTAALAGAESVLEVCAAIARAAGRVNGGPAVAYAIHSTAPTFAAACWNGAAIEQSTWASGPRWRASGPTTTQDAVLDRFMSLRGCGVRQNLPFGSGDRDIGALLLLENDPTSGRSPSEIDWSALAPAFAWAIQAAQEREDGRSAVGAITAAGIRAMTGREIDGFAASVAAIAEMAAGAAHELNNPLAVIAGRAQLLQRTATDEELARQAATIDEQARRASQIVAELVQFAKPEPPKPVAIRLGDWVSRLCQHWQSRSELPASAVTVQLSDSKLLIHADPGQLDEAAHSVIANAVEAMAPGTARLIINSPSCASDETVVVSFGDNGCGMTPEVLRHACDPFFSSRPAGRGRGMGLARAARLLQVNGGRLWIESAPQAGTRVFFALPTARGPVR